MSYGGFFLDKWFGSNYFEKKSFWKTSFSIISIFDKRISPISATTETTRLVLFYFLLMRIAFISLSKSGFKY
jgi:hypothetical protein